MSEVRVIVSLEIDGAPVARGASTYHAPETVTPPEDAGKLCPLLTFAASDAVLDLMASELLVTAERRLRVVGESKAERQQRELEWFLDDSDVKPE